MRITLPEFRIANMAAAIGRGAGMERRPHAAATPVLDTIAAARNIEPRGLD